MTQRHSLLLVFDTIFDLFILLIMPLNQLNLFFLWKFAEQSYSCQDNKRLTTITCNFRDIKLKIIKMVIQLKFLNLSKNKQVKIQKFQKSLFIYRYQYFSDKLSLNNVQNRQFIIRILWNMKQSSSSEIIDYDLPLFHGQQCQEQLSILNKMSNMELISNYSSQNFLFPSQYQIGDEKTIKEYSKRSLKLKRLTSFEVEAMGVYGKRIEQSYINLIDKIYDLSMISSQRGINAGPINIYQLHESQSELKEKMKILGNQGIVLMRLYQKYEEIAQLLLYLHKKFAEDHFFRILQILNIIVRHYKHSLKSINQAIMKDELRKYLSKKVQKVLPQIVDKSSSLESNFYTNQKIEYLRQFCLQVLETVVLCMRGQFQRNNL